MYEHMFVISTAGMRPFEQHRRVLELVEAGLNDCEIDRLLGIPRRTVLDWRHGRRKSVAPPTRCDGSHDFSRWTMPAYAYLLGAYLGDGYISRSKRSFVMRVTLDPLSVCCHARSPTRCSRSGLSGP